MLFFCSISYIDQIFSGVGNSVYELSQFAVYFSVKFFFINLKYVHNAFQPILF